MSDTGQSKLRKLLAFAAIAEIGTGLALMVDPVIVVRLLLGADIVGVGLVTGRCFGITLLALGLACWPRGQYAELGSPLLGMLFYNALIALFLAYLFIVGHLGGVLLWPGVVLHAVVALLLMWLWRNGRREAR